MDSNCFQERTKKLQNPLKPEEDDKSDNEKGRKGKIILIEPGKDFPEEDFPFEEDDKFCACICFCDDDDEDEAPTKTSDRVKSKSSVPTTSNDENGELKDNVQTVSM